MADIAVVDYGMGNLRSVHQALRAAAPDVSVAVTDDPREIARAGRVVFPGQGAMPDCMREMDARGLRAAILDAARDKPFLGICIGLQMLFERSEEGDTPGLGILPGAVVRFAPHLRDGQGNKLKVPHMGWNQVNRVLSAECRVQSEKTAVTQHSAPSTQHFLWNDIPQGARFYFVHSYYARTPDAALVQASTDYPQPFTCAVARGNLFAVQFHPEKSAQAGLTLLRNFSRWEP